MSKDLSILKQIGSYAVYLLLVPTAVAVGVFLLNDRQYMLISVLIALFACVPFFVVFEKGKNTVRELVIIAVMTALSVVGRLIFAPLPGFKPVTAIVIITGIALGKEAGFITGSLTALCSNIFYGQGPWTPFQMFCWGILGFIVGAIFFKKQNYNMFWLVLCGIIGGILFSLLMDVWTTLAISGEFVFSEYIANITYSLPMMAEYAISNAIFLFVLAKPFFSKLNRIKIKYGVFNVSE